MCAMGRIFEVRKHAMLRVGTGWQSSSRALPRTSLLQCTRRTRPRGKPTLRRVLQNARAVNMPKDKTDAAIRRASGKEAANYQEIIYEGYAPHGVALLVETATIIPRAPWAAAQHLRQERGNLGTTAASASCSRKWRVSLGPGSVKDQDELELDLIDYGLEEMGDSTGDKASRNW